KAREEIQALLRIDAETACACRLEKITSALQAIFYKKRLWEAIQERSSASFDAIERQARVAVVKYLSGEIDDDLAALKRNLGVTTLPNDPRYRDEDVQLLLLICELQVSKGEQEYQLGSIDDAYKDYKSAVALLNPLYGKFEDADLQYSQTLGDLSYIELLLNK